MADPIKQAVQTDVSAVKAAVSADAKNVETFAGKVKAFVVAGWKPFTSGFVVGVIVEHVARHFL
jgi:hypothetical protein